MSWVAGEEVSKKLQGDGLHRIYQKIELIPFSTCWYWMGSIFKATGYGQICVNKKTLSAHRYSYIKHKGEIPKGMHIMHSCHNRLCVNPDHLHAGTAKENEAQKVEAGRQAKGEGNGFAKLTEDVVRQIRARDSLLSEEAARYGVSESCIRRARLGHTWGHVK